MALDRRTGVTILALLLGAGGIGVGAGALMGDRETGGRTVTAGAVTASPTPTPVLVPQRTATRIPGPLPGATVEVPVYVLGGTGSAARLFREFRSGDGGDPVRAAVAGLAASTHDPDYRSPWYGVPSSVTRSGGTATVTFSAAPTLAGAGTAVAVQQVVYTVTAADNAITKVRVVAPGLPAALTATALARGAQADLLAPVWLLDPVDGAAAGGRLTITGTASVFEATVSIEVRRGSAVMARTTATASVGAPGRGDWKATVSLPAGDYVVAAYEAAEKDGGRVGVDTKRVTVT